MTLVIAHRGASGYLPENTLAAFAMAHASGADAIEFDVILTRDRVPVVFHDLTLEGTTDVRERFPERARQDGHWYAIDLRLEELERLQVRQRFASRFQGDGTGFRIPTLRQTLQLLEGLNRATDRRLVPFAELKSPTFHERHGLDLEAAVLEALAELEDVTTPPAALIAAEPRTLERLRRELGARTQLVQLIDCIEAFDFMATPAGLDEIARYASAVGPHKRRIEDASGASVAENRLVREAHARGLLVLPFPFRADDHAPGCDDFERELERFCIGYGVDGLFTDFPDRTLTWLHRSGPGRRPRA